MLFRSLDAMGRGGISDSCVWCHLTPLLVALMPLVQWIFNVILVYLSTLCEYYDRHKAKSNRTKAKLEFAHV